MHGPVPAGANDLGKAAGIITAGVDGPREDIDVLLSGSCKHQKEPPTMTIAMIGLDTAKTVFQVHGIDKSGRAVLRRKLHRSELVRFFLSSSRNAPYSSRPAVLAITGGAC